MKLKSILGVCVATAAMTASCFNCFAADEAITYGAPIDLATAQEVSGDIVAGTHIAVPVELSNQMAEQHLLQQRFSMMTNMLHLVQQIQNYQMMNITILLH